MRNYQILEEVYASGLRRISLTDRRVSGFDRRFFTSVDRTLTGRQRYHLYGFVFSIRSGSICCLEREEPQAFT